MGKMKGSRDQPLPLEAGKRLETRRFFQLRRPRVETAAGRPKPRSIPPVWLPRQPRGIWGAGIGLGRGTRGALMPADGWPRGPFPSTVTSRCWNAPGSVRTRSWRRNGGQGVPGGAGGSWERSRSFPAGWGRDEPREGPHGCRPPSPGWAHPVPPNSDTGKFLLPFSPVCSHLAIKAARNCPELSQHGAGNVGNAGNAGISPSEPFLAPRAALGSAPSLDLPQDPAGEKRSPQAFPVSRSLLLLCHPGAAQEGSPGAGEGWGQEGTNKDSQEMGARGLCRPGKEWGGGSRSCRPAPQE